MNAIFERKNNTLKMYLACKKLDIFMIFVIICNCSCSLTFTVVLKHSMNAEYVILTLLKLRKCYLYIFWFQTFQNIIISFQMESLLLVYNLSVNQFGSQMRPHIFLWGLIWIQSGCKGHQQSTKSTLACEELKAYDCD